MHPNRVQRHRLVSLTDLPNVGPRIAEALSGIGIDAPGDLIGRDPLALYQQLCIVQGERVDPCALDVMISIVRFMDGEPPRAWWQYTQERKRKYPGI
jgi:hypothetical protein